MPRALLGAERQRAQYRPSSDSQSSPPRNVRLGRQGAWAIMGEAQAATGARKRRESWGPGGPGRFPG